jgi:hypothetical protein
MMAEIRDSTRHPVIRRFYDYWDEKRGDRPFPSRADIDPLDFKFALGRVSLIDVTHDPLRFRYRIVASYLTEHLGYEMTGKFADEIPEPATRDYTIGRYTDAVMAHAPVHELGDVVIDGRHWAQEVLLLPLARDGVVREEPTRSLI